jgi:hypothetical protein
MITTDPKRLLTKRAEAADADASSEDVDNHLFDQQSRTA